MTYNLPDDVKEKVERLASTCAQHLRSTATDPGYMAAKTTPKKIIRAYLRQAYNLNRTPPAPVDEIEGLQEAIYTVDENLGDYPTSIDKLLKAAKLYLAASKGRG